MKDKLDLIIQWLEDMSAIIYWRGNSDSIQRFDEVLAAARELKALKPVAWGAKSIYGGFEGLSFDKQPRFNTPLYALDEEKT